MVSSANAGHSFNASIIAVFLCCPSFIKKVALSDISRIPTSGYSSENEVKSIFPSTEPANAEKTYVSKFSTIYLLIAGILF